MKTIKLDHGTSTLKELYKQRDVMLDEIRKLQKEISETELQLLLAEYALPHYDDHDNKAAI